MSRAGSRAPRIVGGRYRGRALKVPDGFSVRPTAHRMREALFNILEHGLSGVADARFLDLFCGSGAIGLEALSRGAVEVLMVDNDRRAAAVARANSQVLGEEGRAKVLLGDATRLGPCAEPFDLVYLDPPYRSGMAEPALRSLLSGCWIAGTGRIICELGAREPLCCPAGLTVSDERRYGAGRLVMLAPSH